MDNFYPIQQNVHEHAIGDSPLGPFEYGGIICDNTDLDPASWNNYGSIAEINGEYYIFFHASTNNTERNRRARVEKITINEDGSIDQVENTSLGFDAYLDPYGDETLAAYACYLAGDTYIGTSQEDSGEMLYPLTRITNSSVAAFKYYEFGELNATLDIEATLRPKNGGTMEIWADVTDDDPGQLLGAVEIPAGDGTEWVTLSASLEPLQGRHSIYLVFSGEEAEELDALGEDEEPVYIEVADLLSFQFAGTKEELPDYTVEATHNGGGTVTVTRNGERAELEIVPDEGYKLLSILIDGVTADLSAMEDNTYVIDNVDKDITVRVLFIGNDEDFAARYTDVTPKHENGEDTWYYEAVNILTGLGVLEGYEDGTLAPAEEIKRAEFTKLMYALAELLGEDVEIIDEVPFGDAQTSWAKGYIGWAHTNSLVTGYDEDTFGPDDDIIRQDMALFMMRLFDRFLEYDLPGSRTLTFSDADEISEYAGDAVTYAVRTGLMEGHATGEFAPGDGTQRCHVAQVLYNYLVYTD